MDTGVDDDQDVEGLEPGEIILDTPDPPDDLPYADFEDYRARALLEVNAILLTEDALVRTLDHPESVLRGAAAHALGSLGSTAAIPALERLASAASDLVRVEAAYALVRLGRDEYRAVLEEALNYPINAYLSPAVAAGDLARLGDPAGFPVIARCLEEHNLIVKIIGCKQLFFFVPFHGTRTRAGQRVDVYALFDRALHDPEREVQRVARLQLREVSTEEARRLLDAST